MPLPASLLDVLNSTGWIDPRHPHPHPHPQVPPYLPELALVRGRIWPGLVLALQVCGISYPRLRVKGVVMYGKVHQYMRGHTEIREGVFVWTG